MQWYAVHITHLHFSTSLLKTAIGQSLQLCKIEYSTIGMWGTTKIKRRVWKLRTHLKCHPFNWYNWRTTNIVTACKPNEHRHKGAQWSQLNPHTSCFHFCSLCLFFSSFIYMCTRFCDALAQNGQLFKINWGKNKFNSSLSSAKSAIIL